MIIIIITVTFIIFLSPKAMEVQRAVTVLLSLIFLILHSASSSSSSSAQQQVPLNSAIERSALLDLRSSLAIKARHWPIKAEPCSSWVGVECRSGRVTGINVAGLNRTRVGRLNPRFAVDALANLTSLASFNSSGFALPGTIPDWFGTRLLALRVLDLRSCSVTGSIPFSLGNLSTLSSLYLSNNLLTGAIPTSLSQLVGLSVLNISNNLITGTVPAAISNLRNLTRLDLSSNYLSGSIPPGIGNISSIQFLNLSNNSFTSVIPVQLCDLSQLIELDLGLNSLTGSLPVNLKELRSLQKMVIGNNNIEGPLPDNLFQNLSQLQFVVLSGNQFDGVLPDALLSMPSLRSLDVSSNNFTGILPKFSLMVNATDSHFNLSNNLFYGSLNSPLEESGVIDLSSNYLQGKVPKDTGNSVIITRNCLQTLQNQRSLADCTLFYEERGLTFDNFGGSTPSESPLPESTSKNNKRLIYILAGVFGGLCFVVLLVSVLLCIIRTCEKGVTNQRGNANVGPVPEEGNPPLPKDTMNLSGLGASYTYEQMLQYTGDFSETNLIKHGHSGDLFQGTLEGGAPVVIKRVDLHSFKKEAYMMELEFFSKVVHTRLVPLLGHCLEHDNEKFLVYKYMPNGDLCKSLYRPNNSEDDSIQSLDWITRLKIAIGTAEGLSHLHHECSPPLVHRDIQSTSILLDDKFEVRLGSLSELRAQEGDGHQNVITRLLRKPQISEQCPLGSSPTNCAYDVYCFGKVLLELVTGKLGISKSDDATVKEWLEHTLPYISIHDKEMVTKIVDPSLIIDEDLLEEVWAMAIVARSCLNPKPSKRPPMRYIFKALENPLKVVREDSNSGRLRTTSSRRSWSAAVFGSWRQSSSESASVPYQTNREGISGLKQSGRIGSQSSNGNELSSSRKRLSSEIFPEPVYLQDVERQDV